MDDERHDPTTGEILPPEPHSFSRAANGVTLPGPAKTGGQFLDLLEDGAISAEMAAELRDLAATMQDIGRDTGAKVKGKLTIAVDLSFEDGAFRIGAKFDVKKPELPRPRSIVWTDENNNFTRFPPNQGQFFGARTPSGSGEVRRVS